MRHITHLKRVAEVMRLIRMAWSGVRNVRKDGSMSTYLARVTVRHALDCLEDDEMVGMADALGAVGTPRIEASCVVFDVPGEAPDSTLAFAAASQHAAEVLDGYVYDIEVAESFD
jgi:hypothetical protein